jgi:hypothetical protein
LPKNHAEHVLIVQRKQSYKVYYKNMVYKRYIKRGERTFGPYYYESYRDEKGEVKTKFISGPKNKNLMKKKLSSLFLITALSLVLIISLFGFTILLSKSRFLINNITGKIIEKNYLSNLIDKNDFNNINIIDAEHLDSNGNVINNVYNEVKDLDSLFSEVKPNEFLRVYFEKNLTNKNDITIYAKSKYNKQSRIEVYPKNSRDFITSFNNVSNEGFYKVLLTNLSSKKYYNIFDLKVLDNYVLFDYVTDPENPPGMNWNATYDSGGTDNAAGIAVDSSGNVYVTGNEGNNYDYYTIKYNSTGGLVWNRIYDSGGAADIGKGIAVDSLGNVYVTGSVDSTSHFTLKYNSSGGSILNITGSFRANAIAVDNSSNIYVTGGNANDDYFTIKYNSTGGHVWNASYDSGATDISNGITIDNSGNVYVTGKANSNYYTIKYNSTGGHVWNASYDSGATDSSNGIYLDSDGNVYVTGQSNNNYYSIKYNSTGGQVWADVYDSGGTDLGKGIAVDNLGNVYVTGTANENYYTIKYNSTGSKIWNITYDSGEADTAVGITIDSVFNVYVIGTSGTANPNYFTIKYGNASLDQSPAVTLIFPINNTNTTNPLQYFLANFSDDINLRNATFYLWNSTGNNINTTSFLINGLTNQSNTSYTLPYEGRFYWNYYACDNSSNCVFNSTIDNSDDYITSKSEFSNKTISKKGDLIKEIVYNYTLIYDITPPVFTGIENITLFVNNSVLSNINASDLLTSVNQYFINWTNTFSINSSGHLINTSALTIRMYWINVSVNDTLGNINSSVIYVNATDLPDTTTQILSNCSKLEIPNKIYSVNQTLYSNTTCLNITASNVTLECNNNLIYYGNSSVSSSYGIVVSNSSLNSTIKNCKVIELNSTGNYKHGILFINSGNSSNVYNNTVNISSGYTYGIYLLNVKLLGLYNNTLNMDLLNAGFLSGLYLSNSSNNNFSYNTINSINNFGLAYGIYMYSDSDSNIFSYNNFSINTRNSYSFLSAGGSTIKQNNISVYNNFFNTAGSMSKHLYVVSGEDFNFYNNQLESSNNSNYQIYLYLSNKTNIVNNTLRSTGLYSYGILNYFSNYTRIINNTILLTGYNSLGIYNYFSSHGIIFNNSVTTNDSLSCSLYFYYKSYNNTINKNIIQSKNYYAAQFYYSADSAIESNKNNIYNNIFNGSSNPVFIAYTSNNSYNTTKTLQTNIINRPYIGGNLWTNKLGKYFPLNCEDMNADYICDNNYTFYQNGIDFLPLTNGDSNLPLVFIASPNNNTVVNGLVRISVLASDNTGIKNITFEYSNSTVPFTSLGSDATSPYYLLWNTSLFSNSSEGYYIKVTAYDYFNNTNSTTYRFYIDRTRPFINDISVIYPTNQESIRNSQTIILKVNVTDSNEVSAGINITRVNLSSINSSGVFNMRLESGSLLDDESSVWNISVLVSGTTGNNLANILVYDNATPINNLRNSDNFIVFIDNNNPLYSSVINRPTQPYNNTDTIFSIDLEDNFKLKSYIFSSNITGAWINESGAVTGTSENIIITKRVYNGNYSYKFFMFDDSGNSNQTEIYNFSVNGESPAFTIFLNSPLNNVNSSINTQNFTFYYINGEALNCSLYFNGEFNDTILSPLNNTVYNFTKTLSDNFYSWYTSCIENNSELSIQQSSIYNLIIDTTSPVFDNIENITTYYNNSLISDINASDSLAGINQYFINWTDTFSINSSGHLINTSALTIRIYWINVSVNDTLGNTRSSVIYVNATDLPDSQAPLISIVYPINNTNYSTNISQLNYTVSDNGVLSFCWYSRTNGTSNSSTVSSGTNFTNVISVEGDNYWTVYCNDSMNNQNSSKVYFFKDTVYPLIQIVNPTNNTNSSNTGLDVNYTYTEINPSQCWYNNGTGINQTITCGTNITSVTWTEGTYNLTVYINDTVGNINFSKVVFRIDTTSPVFDNIENITTYYNNSLISDINASDSLAGINQYFINWTDTFSINSSGHLINTSALTIRIYWINVSVNDTLGNTKSSVIYVNSSSFPDTINPSVILISPVNNSNTSNSLQYFIANFSDNVNLKNTTLYLWNSTRNNINTTSLDILGTINQSNLSSNLSYEGRYFWNYKVCDNSSSCLFNNSNFTLLYDRTSPVITFSCSPTSVNVGETITCLCSSLDDYDSNPVLSYTVNPGTGSSGSFTTSCTATDDSLNSAISNVSYSVTASGGGNSGGGGGGGTVVLNCNSNSWNCAAWSDCKDGKNYRTCTKNSACNGEGGKPSEIKTCDLCDKDFFECSNWSSCDNGIQTRECTKKIDCENDNTIPKQEKKCSTEGLRLGSFEDNERYISDYNDENCKEWSECKVIYNLDNLIYENIDLIGEKERVCIIDNKKVIQRIRCDPKKEIKVSRNNRCYMNYLDISDKNNVQLLSLEKMNKLNPLLNLEMNINSKSYCYYCFDKIKNFDEDDIDCVNLPKDSCPKCLSPLYNLNISDKIKLNFFSYLKNYILLFLLLLLLIILYLVYKYYKNKKKLHKSL